MSPSTRFEGRELQALFGIWSIPQFRRSSSSRDLADQPVDSSGSQRCLTQSHSQSRSHPLGIRDENSRKQSLKLLNHFRNCIFCRERKQEQEIRMGKRNRYYGMSGTESFGRDSGACRLRSRIDNSKRENTYNHFKYLTRQNNYNSA